MATGIVKWFNAERAMDSSCPMTAERSFAHYSEIRSGATNRCRRISAYPSRWDKGPRAKRQEHKVIA